mmetsp:Transcript_24628/g.36165  ORF Transcript_24628/g.36165 Transcript_24628/m.36165 type:complete len:144 (-) Transcript_24628:752-1183(-)
MIGLDGDRRHPLSHKITLNLQFILVASMMKRTSTKCRFSLDVSMSFLHQVSNYIVFASLDPEDKGGTTLPVLCVVSDMLDLLATCSQSPFPAASKSFSLSLIADSLDQSEQMWAVRRRCWHLHVCYNMADRSYVVFLRSVNKN